MYVGPHAAPVLCLSPYTSTRLLLLLCNLRLGLESLQCALLTEDHPAICDLMCILGCFSRSAKYNIGILINITLSLQIAFGGISML